MILGMVVTNIVATVKHAALKGHTLLWIQPITSDGAANGEGFIALDSIEAGPGDTVIVCNEGAGCKHIFDAGLFPVNHVIAGFVDRV